jgi:hypothetical protein
VHLVLLYTCQMLHSRLHVDTREMMHGFEVILFPELNTCQTLLTVQFSIIVGTPREVRHKGTMVQERLLILRTCVGLVCAASADMTSQAENDGARRTGV